jgi:hypothetical protein
MHSDFGFTILYSLISCHVATGLRKRGRVATPIEMSHIAQLLRRRKAPQLRQTLFARGFKAALRGGIRIGNKFTRSMGHHGEPDLHTAIMKCCDGYFKKAQPLNAVPEQISQMPETAD